MQKSIWMSSDSRSIDEWKRDFGKISKAGIQKVLLSGTKTDFESALKAVSEFNLEIHAWIFTMLCNDEEIVQNHPDWFTVNGLGELSCHKPQYVGYYKWLCPNNPEVQKYLSDKIEKLCNIINLNGVHLDYIRFCDVILPKALQPNYNLTQTKEEPQYDYCYCQHCRKAFKEQTGIDPCELKQPFENRKWLQFRYDSITNIVLMLKEIVHKNGKQITAAVFPTIMQKNVRQQWHKWQLDAFHPMLYHSCYGEDLSWIGTEAKNCKTLLINTRLYPGIYMPDITPDKLMDAIRYVKSSGADGVSFFDFNSMKNVHWRVLHKNELW